MRLATTYFLSSKEHFEYTGKFTQYITSEKPPSQPSPRGEGAILSPLGEIRKGVQLL
jgi:hypothetical protein